MNSIVKELHWTQAKWLLIAASPFCRYTIEPVDDDTGPHWQTKIAYEGSVYRRSESEEDAKAAAQADYEQRVLSALSVDLHSLKDENASQATRIAELEDELYEAQQLPWPEWAERILKALQKNGYDPVDNGEVDLAGAFEDYLAGIDEAERHESERIASLKSQTTALEGRVRELEEENGRLKSEIERFKSERLYILGFNDGYCACEEGPQPGDDEPFETIDAMSEQRLHEIADGAWGDNPMIRGNAREELKRRAALQDGGSDG